MEIGSWKYTVYHLFTGLDVCQIKVSHVAHHTGAI